jgi:hypothetical protein
VHITIAIFPAARDIFLCSRKIAAIFLTLAKLAGQIVTSPEKGKQLIDRSNIPAPKNTSEQPEKGEAR